MVFLVPFLLISFGVVGFLGLHVYRRNMHIWLGSHLGQVLRPRPEPGPGECVHILFAVVDHYEPLWRCNDMELAIQRVDKWVREYPRLADRHGDSDGIPPQHTFFYPQEEYQYQLIEKLAQLCHRGYGEVEVHLHHDNDTSTALRQKLETFKEQLISHGLLCRNGRDGRIQYGFIHGNWALDNSRRDGRWCGVNDELLILKETGCYADFTLPTAPSETQTRTINRIYYATDDPGRPKSHDRGVEAEVNGSPSGDLMIIQGPLTLDWVRRKWGLFPRIESGEIKGDNPPSEHRADLWLKPRIHVKGNPNWVFIKVYTHGTQERNAQVLFGRPMDSLFSYMEDRYNDGRRYRLHYVTAREMFNIIKAAEEGLRGDPQQYRNHVLCPLVKSERAHRVSSSLGGHPAGKDRTGG